MFFNVDVPDATGPAVKKTEVFFVPACGPSRTDSPSSREPIIITQNVDSVHSSVTSSLMSGSGHTADDDDEVNSDDFCMIDDAGWGKTVSWTFLAMEECITHYD